MDAALNDNVYNVDRLTFYNEDWEWRLKNERKF